MTSRMAPVVATLLCAAPQHLAGQPAEPPFTIVVAGSGSGDCRTIQEALDAIPGDRNEWTVVLVRKGDYREKVYWTKSNVALVGEDRDSTRIFFPVLRSGWTASNGGSDWGSAVINIGDGVHDVVLANLSVRNTFGDSTGNHDHQFSIRGFRATRIALLYSTITSAGGDALSLWDRDSGMYYHAFCTFEGWVDYVCPRGWCYITDSRFFGHNLPSASIWHDGSGSKDQKFVIRNSAFDGVPGFPLGRHHRDAQFFLLDCRFSAAMADKPLYAPRSPNTVEWKWGQRHYFWRCKREGQDFAWYADNLEEAEGQPQQAQIDARWTFGGRWDPEGSIPVVLPFAGLPFPRNEAHDLQTGEIVLRWLPARGTKEEIVEFGTSPGTMRAVRADQSRLIVRDLAAGQRYQWRVRTIAGRDTVTGDLWAFTTRGN